MTKHISGLILFSLIVGISVFVSAVATDSVPVTLSHDYRLTKKKKRKHKRHHCDFRRPTTVELSLADAVFDENTGIFSAVVSSERSDAEGNLDLHFYANDRFGPRFLKTERFAYSSYYVTFDKEFGWLKSLDRDQEVFVIPAFSRRSSHAAVPPEFDPLKAVPVVIRD